MIQSCFVLPVWGRSPPEKYKRKSVIGGLAIAMAG